MSGANAQRQGSGPPRVDPARLFAELEALGRIGRSEEDHGIYRPAFSEAYMEAHRWLHARAQDAGLRVWIDPAHNLHARVGPEGPGVIATGSHIDTVPRGGHLDGALGVVAGLEALRRIVELDIELRRPVELIAFADEEGRFGGMFGSQALSGNLTPDAILRARDLRGVSLVEAMEAHGLDAMHALSATARHGHFEAFVELHIEQGPLLDDAGVALGVVEGIVGLFRWRVRLIGTANHAGTTPMDRRKDAFQGLAEVAGELQRVLDEEGGERSVATIGRVELSPGAANVVPGTATFSLEVRDLDPDVLSGLGLALRKAISAIARRRGLMFEYEVMSELDPVACDPGLRDLIARQAEALGVPHLSLPSGAAHDSQMMADLAKIGMIFVPSKDGKSHNPAEWTDLESIEHGANCLLGTLVALATEGSAA